MQCPLTHCLYVTHGTWIQDNGTPSVIYHTAALALPLACAGVCVAVPDTTPKWRNVYGMSARTATERSDPYSRARRPCHDICVSKAGRVSYTHSDAESICMVVTMVYHHCHHRSHHHRHHHHHHHHHYHHNYHYHHRRHHHRHHHQQQ